eukprot:950899_1
MNTSTAALAFAALLASSPVNGREAMLSDENNGQRRLGFFYHGEDYYKSIWYRCCNTTIGEEGDESKNNPDWRRDGWQEAGIGSDEYCKCPVRGSDRKGWFSSSTYFEKWTEKCADDGWIAQQAGIN